MNEAVGGLLTGGHSEGTHSSRSPRRRSCGRNATDEITTRREIVADANLASVLQTEFVVLR